MKLEITDVKFAVGPTIGGSVRTYISKFQKDLQGIEMKYDTEEQILHIAFRDKRLIVPQANLAYMELEKVASGSNPKKTGQNPA